MRKVELYALFPLKPSYTYFTRKCYKIIHKTIFY